MERRVWIPQIHGTFQLIALVITGMLVCTPLIAGEQAGRVPRIGVLTPGDVGRWVKAIYQGLQENGYVDATTATIDWRATGARFDSGPRLAEELISLQPDVIFAAPGLLAKDVADAEVRAGKQIPIVLLTWDPVAEGLVASAAHPGGSITGVAYVYVPGADITKQLQLLKDVLPRLKRVACLIDTTWQKDFGLQAKAALEKAVAGIGVRVTTIEVGRPDDLDHALTEVVRSRPGAMIITVSPLFAAMRSQIIDFASNHRLATIYWEELFSYDGGFMSYGPSVSDMHRRATGIMAKILHGAKPADIPVEYNTQFRLVVNLRTAKALGVTVPQSVLIQADEVVR
jgi:putative ABC transport system substrate-binding protein